MGGARPLVYFAAGGTGGHVYPALAAAEALRRRGAEVRFVGTRERLEGRLVPAAGYELVPVKVRGLPRRPGPGQAAAMIELAAAVAGLARRFGRERPALVVGFGGYVSAPAVLAARLRGVPAALHEQNAVPGLANRWLSRWAARVAVSFAGTAAWFPAGKAVVTGNPVRAELHGDRAAARKALGLGPDELLLLAFGGSQGARSLNQALLPLAPALLERPGLRVFHVCGQTDWERCRATAPDDPRYELVPYCEDLPARLLAADLALTRAGATTVAEAAAARLPCVLVPYPHAAGHQEANAAPLVAAGGALQVADRDLSPESLWAQLGPLLAEPARLAGMRERLAALSPDPPAAERLAGLLESLIQWPNDEAGTITMNRTPQNPGETMTCCR